jgi:hypothetical protein
MSALCQKQTHISRHQHYEIAVSTIVPKPDRSRAVGTVLAGPALESIKASKSRMYSSPRR